MTTLPVQVARLHEGPFDGLMWPTNSQTVVEIPFGRCWAVYAAKDGRYSYHGQQRRLHAEPPTPCPHCNGVMVPTQSGAVCPTCR